VVVGTVALTTGLVVLVSTWHGIGVTPVDSLAYLTMADEVARGDMPFPPPIIGVPPTHFPPGWSLLVGGLAAIVPGAEPLGVARLVNAAFAASLPVLVYGALRSRARHGPWLPVLFAVYVAASYPLFELASRAVAEPMFLSLLLISLLATDRARRDRSTASLLVAAALVGALVLTRYVGVAVLLPLGLVAVAGPSAWGRRLGRLVAVGTLSLAPVATWYALAPGPLASTHIDGSERFGVRGDGRAGLSELVHSVREAGVTVARGVFLPETVRFLVGLGLLLAPLAALAVTGATSAAEGTRARRVVAWTRRCGAGVWLSFAVAYTVLVAVQRWHIDREFIARYWLPYWLVAVVVVGWCVIEWARRPARAWRTAVTVTAVAMLLLTTYNAAQIAKTARSNAQDGVTLNAIRYQRSDVLAAVADPDIDVVHADEFELVAFQRYAQGSLVRVERLSCRAEGLDELAAAVTAELDRGVRPAVAALGRCRQPDFVEELVARFPGATVVRDGQGVVVIPEPAAG
jgi:hypothetical protein